MSKTENRGNGDLDVSTRFRKNSTSMEEAILKPIVCRLRGCTRTTIGPSNWSRSTTFERLADLQAPLLRIAEHGRVFHDKAPDARWCVEGEIGQAGADRGRASRRPGRVLDRHAGRNLGRSAFARSPRRSDPTRYARALPLRHALHAIHSRDLAARYASIKRWRRSIFKAPRAHPYIREPNAAVFQVVDGALLHQAAAPYRSQPGR